MTTTNLPKYQQIKRLLVKEVLSGRWEAGSAFPSESQLLQRFKVSRPTLIRSLQEMVRDGYLYREQGRGTFVAHRPMNGQQSVLPVFISTYTAALSGDAREVQLRILRGIQSALRHNGTEVLVRQAAPGVLDRDNKRFIDENIPGAALIIEPSFNDPLWQYLTDRDWQAWSLNEPVDHGCCVFIDQEQAGYVATRCLLEDGCRRIALLNGPLEAYWGFAARQRGYQNALADAGIHYDPDLMLQGEHPIDSEAGREMMRRLLQSGIEFDGVVGASDTKAIGAIAQAKEAGRKVPDEIHFVSIDNTLAERCDTPLPAVAMPFEQVGEQAVHQAMRAIKEDRAACEESGARSMYTRICLEPKLVRR